MAFSIAWRFMFGAQTKKSIYWTCKFKASLSDVRTDVAARFLVSMQMGVGLCTTQKKLLESRGTRNDFRTHTCKNPKPLTGLVSPTRQRRPFPANRWEQWGYNSDLGHEVFHSKWIGSSMHRLYDLGAQAHTPSSKRTSVLLLLLLILLQHHYNYSYSCCCY